MTYLTIARRHARLILVVVLCAVLGSVFVSSSQETRYTATAAVQVQAVASPFRSTGGTKSDLTRAMQTQMDLVRGDAVRSRVATTLGTATAPPVTVSPRGQADEIEIAASAASADRAAGIANAYAQGYAAELAELDRKAVEAGEQDYEARYRELQDRIAVTSTDAAATKGPQASRLKVQLDVLVAQLKALAIDQATATSRAPAQLGATIVAAATPPDSPTSPRPLRLGLLALLGGCVVGYAAAALRESVSDKIVSALDVRVVDPGATVLGPVPDRADTHDLVLHGTDADAYRALRAEVGALIVRGAPAVVNVTAPVGDEGTSAVATNLALTLARAGRGVTIIDCNVRAPVQHIALGCAKEPGLVDVLSGQVPLKAVLVRPTSAPDHLFLVPAGSSEDVDVLAGPAFVALVAELARNTDVVIVDAPPVLRSAEAITVAEVASMTLLVVRSGTTRRRDLRAAMERLRLVNDDFTAVVVTAPLPARTPVRVGLRRPHGADDEAGSEPAASGGGLWTGA